MIRRFLYCLFALVVAMVATGAELRLPEPIQMDCGATEDGTCPCGMPMPERSPAPCSTSLPSPVAVPTQRIKAIIEYATSADQTALEPKPWPVSWTLLHRLDDEKWMASQPIPVDTGPPLLASERTALLRVFLI